jgi:hypothetical protein
VIERVGEPEPLIEIRLRQLVRGRDPVSAIRRAGYRTGPVLRHHRDHAVTTETPVAPGIKLRSSGSYATRLGDQYLGSFKTRDAAEAARREAKAKARLQKQRQRKEIKR